MPFRTSRILPCHGSFFFTHLGCERPGAGLVGLNRPPNDLIDVRHEADDLGADRAVRVLDDLQGVLVLDRLAAGVELDDAAVGDLVGRPVVPRHRTLQCRTHVAAGGLQAADERPGGVVVVVDEAVGCGQLRVPPLHHGLVRQRLPGLETATGAEAADVGADDLRGDDLVRAEECEEQVPRVLLRVDRTVGLLERLQARSSSGSADDPHVAVDRAGTRQLPHERRVVRRVERREHALRDLPADRAEVRDHPGAGRPAEAVVVHDDGGLTPTELLVEDLAEAGVPLGTVAVVAEHVPRRDLKGRILRARRPDDERLRRVGLGVVRHRHGLVTGERSEHHVCPQLLHQPPRLLQRRRYRVVAAAVADDLDVVVLNLDARHACRRLVLVLDLAVRVLGEAGLSAADVELVTERKGAFAVGHDRDPDRVRLRRREGAGSPDGCDGREHRERKQKPPATHVLHVFLPLAGRGALMVETA